MNDEYLDTVIFIIHHSSLITYHYVSEGGRARR
jgi:hypothetical protein